VKLLTTTAYKTGFDCSTENHKKTRKIGQFLFKTQFLNFTAVRFLTCFYSVKLLTTTAYKTGFDCFTENHKKTRKTGQFLFKTQFLNFTAVRFLTCFLFKI
jgi:hypothetical protein